jgi:hypothetical protein
LKQDEETVMTGLDLRVRVGACCVVFLMGCGDAPPMDDADAEMWPKRVTLTTPQAGAEGERIRLSDGVIAVDGDFGIQQAMVISLRSAAAGSFCEKGMSFASLAAIPTDVASCTDWSQVAYLSGTTLHTSEESYAIGVGLLVRDAQHEALYRLLILGDSYAATGVATATFEYEPVP